MEKFKTYFLMIGLTVMFIWFGGLIAGKIGMIIAFIIAFGMNFYAYYYSDQQVFIPTIKHPIYPSRIVSGTFYWRNKFPGLLTRKKRPGL